MNCPKCQTQLEYVEGEYGTGVFAPDGYEERQYQAGFYCDRCNYVYDESDLDDLIDEGNDPDFRWPA